MTSTDKSAAERTSLTTPSKEPAGAVAAVRAGWNVCLRNLFSLTDQTADETADKTGDFERGRRFEAKGIARAMNSFGPDHCEEFRDWFAAPGAAIDAREQEAADAAFYDWCPYDGKQRTDREIFAAGFNAALTSRPEAPPASAPAAEVAQPVADALVRLDALYADLCDGTPERPDWLRVALRIARGAQRGIAVNAALASSPSSAPAESGLTRDALIDLIEENLYGVYHCSRVWEAWNVGTMSRDDFSEARGSELAPDLADAILALAAAPQALQAGGEGGNG